MAHGDVGIETYHREKCSKRRGGSNCTCRPSYRGSVWDPETGKRRWSRRFPRKKDAQVWRSEMLSAKERNLLGPTTSPRISELANDVLKAIDSGAMANRSGRPFKPSTVRTYELHYRNEVDPVVGCLRVTDLRRKHVQDVVDRCSSNRSASSVRNSLMPLRLIVRVAIKRDLLSVNPLVGVEFPAKDEMPISVLSLAEADRLLDALSGRDRGIFAFALFSGLRLGELQALKRKHVDVDARVIRVRSAWDRKEGLIDPKSRAGKRIVPFSSELDSVMAALGEGDPEDFLLGSPTRPFAFQSLYRRTDKALAAVGLNGTRLHSCRHTYASIMIDAGLNPKQLQTYMGHSSIQITYDRYGHLFAGDELQSVEMLSAYLTSARQTRA